MMRSVLFDAQMLIGAYDTDKTNPKHKENRAEVHRLLSDPEVLPAITPQVRFEVMCGIKDLAKIETMEAILNMFDEILISQKEASRAADLFRLYKNQHGFKDEEEGKTWNRYKRAFDFLYCACADVNKLEIASQDKHIQSILKLIQENPTTVSRL